MPPFPYNHPPKITSQNPQERKMNWCYSCLYFTAVPFKELFLKENVVRSRLIQDIFISPEPVHWPLPSPSLLNKVWSEQSSDAPQARLYDWHAEWHTLSRLSPSLSHFWIEIWRSRKATKLFTHIQWNLTNFIGVWNKNFLFVAFSKYASFNRIRIMKEIEWSCHLQPWLFYIFQEYHIQFIQ